MFHHPHKFAFNDCRENITHTSAMPQVDGDSVMDVEIASITQLTNSVQLAEPPPNLLSPQLENDSEAGMDLDGDNDPSRNVPSTRNSGIDVSLSDIQKKKWDHQDEIGTHTGIDGDSDAGRWIPDSGYAAPATGDGAVLASRITRLPTALAGDSRGVLHAMFEGIESHEDDADDSEWLDGASVRADTQSVFAGDSEEDDDGEMGEDDDVMLSGDEVVLQGVPDVVKGG
jgi:hypothetical protein